MAKTTRFVQPAGILNRLWAWVGRFFSDAESTNASVLSLFGVLLSVVFVRIILEWALESQKVIETPPSLFLFLLYFASVLAGLFLILWAVSGKPPLAVAKVVTALSPVLWIPPVWDFVATGGQGETLLFVFSPPPFLDALASACAGCAGVSSGVRVEVLAAALAAIAFVFWASQSWFKAALAGGLLYGFIVLEAVFPAYLMGWLGHAFTDVFFLRELFSSYAILISAAVIVPWLATTSQSMQRLRWVRLLHYAGLVLFGALLGFRYWQQTLPGVALPLVASVASAVFAFEAAVRINDWADEQALTPKSRSKFPSAEVVGFTLLSFVGGLAAGFAVWAWVALALAFSVAYSVPPLRLRRHVMPASVVLAAVSVAVVAAGFGIGFLDQSQVPNSMPSQTVLLVFGFVLLAAPFKDLKDGPDDRKAGVFTLATWLDARVARQVCSVLVFLAVMWATWLSGFSWAIGLMFGMAGAAAVGFIRDLIRMERIVFALEYVFLAFLAAHLSGLLVLA